MRRWEELREEGRHGRRNKMKEEEKGVDKKGEERGEACKQQEPVSPISCVFQFVGVKQLKPL